MQFADPRNDIAFKKIFGNEKKKNILISFLNAILEFQGDKRIIDVKLDNPYQLPDIQELKETILDIKATNEHGESFIVEMQKKNAGDFCQRSLYYTAKAYINQIDQAIDFSALKKVYYIALIDFNIFSNHSYLSRHLIINQETLKQDLKDFEFNFIELKKFKHQLKDCKNIVDKWIYFVNNASGLSMIPEELKAIEEIQEAFQIANKHTWSKKELEVYDYVSMKEATDINALKFTERQGEQRGLEQGMKKGIKQGIKEGIKQGATQIAISLLDVLDDQTIAQKTGISVESVRELRMNKSS